MNAMLKHAIAEVASRPEDEQEAVASLILEELADEQAWQAKFTRDAGRIGALAKQARTRHRRGETTPLAFPPE